MRIKVIFPILFYGMFIACTSEQADDNQRSEIVSLEDRHGGKYYYTSGILKYESSLPSSMGSFQRTIYFDDFGNAEKTVTTTNVSAMGQSMETEVHMLIKDGTVYTWTGEEATGLKTTASQAFDINALNFENISEEWKAKLQFKEEGEEKIDGKNCKVYSMDYEGSSAKVWVWQNMQIKSKVDIMGLSIFEKLVESNLDVEVDSAYFKVPDLEWVSND